MNFYIPKNVKYILDNLKKNNFKAYIVGGCVRDQILNKHIDDYDITTNAKPEDIKKIFKKTIDTGLKHGTVTILIREDNKNYTYEVTTFRIDGEYKDYRHPEKVEFTDELLNDLKRRDFTVNAMAYNEEDGLVDNFNGIEDLNNHIIRCVGNPIERFNEDALRMLRAIRFASKLSFQIDKNTYDAIIEYKQNLSNISKERIQTELTKILLSDNPEMVEKVFDTGLSKYITKDFDSIKLSKIIKTKNIHIAYASLLFENVDIAKNVLKELKLDNNTIDSVSKVLSKKEEISALLNDNDYQITLKSIIRDIGYDLTLDLINIYEYKNDISLDNIKTTINNYRINNTPIFLSDLEVKGDDIISLGFSGKQVGFILNELLNKVYIDEKINNKKDLIELAKNIKI